MEVINNNQEASEILKNGGIIAHPADTCYGLAGDLTNRKALEKIQQIKGRDAGKPMSIILPRAMGYELLAVRKEPVINKSVSQLTANRYQLAHYVKLSDFSLKVCQKLFPGPITLILPKGPKVPSWFFPEEKAIGVRMVDDANVNELLELFGGPIITTSANLSGEPPCYSGKEVIKIFKNQPFKPDAVLMSEMKEKNPPSTVIRVMKNHIEILREGSLKETDITRILATE